MSDIDKILGELKAEYVEGKVPQKKPLPRHPQPPTPTTIPIQISPIPEIFQEPITNSPSLIDNILADVKADFQSLDQAEELKRQEELEQERIQQEKIKQGKIQALRKQAEDWLDKLDALSPEGLWFESFSQGYASKIEAAIEYLQINEG
ncbi:salt stress protein, Slr1339 family [Calothrix sp. 336/3]|uniref:salt stress protein, Slr1339 family n=1 Tax=Calothrix sp. 336/3 TaxID=1337936 RepID=UPI0004E44F7D|nr:hypothetical protein [Calothrix sp. 336/3]AKG23710.1 hypothetical protein IJ00_22625 [Calothrix sp. 336/3]